MALGVDSIRYVLFDVPGGSPPNVLSLWRSFAKSMPQNFQGQGGTSFASGPLRSSQAILSYQPGRLDFVLQASGNGVGFPPQIDDLGQALNDGVKDILIMLKSLSIVRLAIMVETSEPATDDLAAAARVMDAIPFLREKKEIRDLTYQANVRKNSAIQNIEYNRLCKWSVASQQLVQVQVGPQQAPVSTIISSQVVYNEAYDLNSVPKTGKLTTPQCRKLLEEFVSELIALRAGGYSYLIGSS